MIGVSTEDQIEHLLRQEVIGRIGCHAGGVTYVVPVTYAYDGLSIYCHSGEGLKVKMMRENPRVCFEVDHLDNLANWQSVIAQGTFEELPEAAAGFAMQLLTDRLAPLLALQGGNPSHGLPGQVTARAQSAPHVFRIRLDRVSGRFERTGSDPAPTRMPM